MERACGRTSGNGSVQNWRRKAPAVVCARFLGRCLGAGRRAGERHRDGLNGRRLLIKGSTFKTKVDSVEEQEKGDGSTVVVTTRLDRFVPSIRAFDLTVDRPSFGDVLTIK